MANGKYIDIPGLERALAKVRNEFDERINSDFNKLLEIAGKNQQVKEYGMLRGVDKVATLRIKPGFAYLRGQGKIRLRTYGEASKLKSGRISLKGYYFRVGDWENDFRIIPFSECMRLTSKTSAIQGSLTGDDVTWELTDPSHVKQASNLYLEPKPEYVNQRTDYIAVKILENGNKVFYTVSSSDVLPKQGCDIPKVDIDMVMRGFQFEIINGWLVCHFQNPVYSCEAQIWAKGRSRFGQLNDTHKNERTKVIKRSWVPLDRKIFKYYRECWLVRVRYKSRRRTGEWEYFHVRLDFNSGIVRWNPSRQKIKYSQIAIRKGPIKREGGLTDAQPT